MSESASWMHIGLHGHSVGTFTAESRGIRWKSALNTDDNDNITLSRFIPYKSITGGQWTVFGRSGHLRIQSLQDSTSTNSSQGSEFRFDGFPPTDFDNLRGTLSKLYTIDVQKLPIDSSGTSFGLTNISTNGHLLFRECILDEDEEEGEEFEPRDGDEMMSMNLSEVGQCVMQGNTRNEIELQFHESDTVEAGTDQLVSIRFYVPPDPDADAGDKESPTPAEIFQQRILTVANIKNTAGNEIVSFTEAQGTFLTPRGRYKITLYDSHLRMHGNRYDYKIKYDDISRLFLLPRPDDVHMAFVIALDKPIRQGQQRYQILVLQTTKETQEIRVNLDAETLEKEYGGALQPVMRGTLCNLIAKSFKVIAKKKVFVNGKFANAYQQACVKCALRANEGHLYPLEKCFVFIHKPPVFIRFDEVESVEFQRYAGGQGSTRNFDLCVTLARTAGEITPTKDYIFSGIDRSDYAGMYNFLSGKKVKIKNPDNGGPDGVNLMGGPATPASVPPVQFDDDDEEESTDDDFGSGDGEGSSSDDEVDEDLDADEDVDSDLEEARKVQAKKKKTKQAMEQQSKQQQQQQRSTTTTATTTAADSDDDDDFEKPQKSPVKPKNKIQKVLKIEGKSSSSSKTTTSSPKRKKILSSSSTKFSSSSTKATTTKKKTKAKAKGKPKADPNRPKRPITGYMYFNKERRAIIQAKNPDIKFGDLARLVAEEYKATSPEDLQKYLDMSAKDKLRYQDAMKSYTPPDDDSDSDDDSSDSDNNATAKKRKLAAKKKKKKDPNAPKKPLSSYMFYNKDMRAKLKAKNPTLTFGELGALVGKEFKALTEDQLAKYKQMNEDDKVRYQKAMENYTPVVDSDSAEEKQVVKRKKTTVKKGKGVAKMKMSKKEITKKESDSDNDSSVSSSDNDVSSSDDSSDDSDDSSSSGSS